MLLGFVIKTRMLVVVKSAQRNRCYLCMRSAASLFVPSCLLFSHSCSPFLHGCYALRKLINRLFTLFVCHTDVELEQNFINTPIE